MIKKFYFVEFSGKNVSKYEIMAKGHRMIKGVR